MQDLDKTQSWLEEMMAATAGAKNPNAITINCLATLCAKLRTELAYYATAEKLVITHAAKATGAMVIKMEKADHGSRAKSALAYWPENTPVPSTDLSL